MSETSPELLTRVQPDQVVPPTGFTARLTIFTAMAMSFLAVFALALSLATERLADRWSNALARTSTIRISAPEGQQKVQVKAVLSILETTPGIASSRALASEEQQQLLEPWFGPDLPLSDLPIPRLVEIVETPAGYDPENLRLRLSAEAPGAVLDDHTRWRRPLIAAADRLRFFGLLSLVLIAGSMAAMITLAAQAALAANGQVIRVLRLVGARDVYIARAFVTRFTARAFVGSLVGTAAGVVAVAFMPHSSASGDLITNFRFTSISWAYPLGVPLIAAVVAYLATRVAALRMLRNLT